jgi:hypothetical protein
MILVSSLKDGLISANPSRAIKYSALSPQMTRMARRECESAVRPCFDTRTSAGAAWRKRGYRPGVGSGPYFFLALVSVVARAEIFSFSSAQVSRTSAISSEQFSI